MTKAIAVAEKERGMVRIDGSFGEGGGQILRTALGLSLATGKPFRIENIRASRQKPGLLRQHLTAVEAARQVGSAQVEGSELGSKALTFVPASVMGGSYHFEIGTAGSCTLVLQTILPALTTASEPSEVVIEGGTHNSMAPPYDFLERTFVPLLNRMGPKVELRLHRYGFYPAGGGKMSALITPAKNIEPLSLGVRGEVTTQRANAKIANLPRHIAHRELDTIEKALGWPREQLGVEDTKDAVSPGNVVTIEIGDDNVTELFTSFGRLGVSAERVATEAVEQLQAYLASDASVGEYLADQLLVPMALAGGGSFVAQRLTEHAITNMAVIQQFLDVQFDVHESDTHTSVAVVKQH
jgi:RNA 3'-terminal phosphate cyclase (ATP)